MGNILSKLPKNAAEEILSLETPNTSSSFKRVMTSGSSANRNTGLWLSANGVRVESLDINTPPPVTQSRTNILRRNPQTGDIEQVSVIDSGLLVQNEIVVDSPDTYVLSLNDIGTEIEISGTSELTVQVPSGLETGFTCYISLISGGIKIEGGEGVSIVDKQNQETVIQTETPSLYFLTMKSGDRMRVITL